MRRRVLGAELAGTGVVARKHWEPAPGMGGFGAGQIPAVERLAVVVALAWPRAAAVARRPLLLVASGPTRRHARGGGDCVVAVGVAIVVVLPFVLAARHPGDPTLTTWGAAGLIYAGPWGRAVVASAW